MAIKHTSRTPINASQSITSNVRNRNARKPVTASTEIMSQLSPAKQAFARQLQMTARKQAKITAATNTSNIMARPEFMELLPLFVQKLLILDVYGSVAMKSRHQIVPYFKVVADNAKGETAAGQIISSPMVNRLGKDMNFTGRVVKNELVAESGAVANLNIAYTPILPGSVTLTVTADGDTVPFIDNGIGSITDTAGNEVAIINYSTGDITVTAADKLPSTLEDGESIKATYQYDNETVGPDANGEYGAKMGKLRLELDEFQLTAEAHELACYWSIYSAFVAQQEYGTNIADMAKDAAFAELTAEINRAGFDKLKKAATYNPAYNFNIAPVLNGSVVPSDYLNMLKIKFNDAAAGIYQATELTRPNVLTVGTTTAVYLQMLDTFKGVNTEDTVGPYELGTLDQFKVFVDPDYQPNEWVMSCKSNDIRRNSALFGEYMPLTDTAAIGLANGSVQQGYATMYGMNVVNPSTVVSGKLLGV
jgi:hypothetical protein